MRPVTSYELAVNTAPSALTARSTMSGAFEPSGSVKRPSTWHAALNAAARQTNIM